MVTLLSKIFIKNYKDYEDQDVRSALGVLCSFIGIGINIVLFIIKFTAGFLSHAISVTADAFNNLSDAGSSIITLLGFKLAKQKPDPEHPFGHGRFEYISGLLVAVVILIMAFELIRTSVGKIIHPESVEISILTIGVLILSILFKLYMFLYNRNIGTKINSSAMKATSVDSISDTVATTVVLICSILQLVFGWKIDGYAGIAVGIFIGYAGFNTLKETISPLLGQAPDPDFVKAVEKIVMDEELITGIHDMVVHDYGPGRVMVSLHAEVPCDQDILKIHDVIDCVEARIRIELGCHITIHMDPVNYEDEQVAELKNIVEDIIKEIDPIITLHDFRIVEGDTHTNLIFDIVVPHNYKISDDNLKKQIGEEVYKKKTNHFCVIEVDKDYAGVQR